MTVLDLMLLLLLGQPDSVRASAEAAGHFLRWARAFSLSVRRSQVSVEDAIRVLNGAALVGLGIVGYCAVGVWPDATVAGRLVFALAVAVAVYIIMGTLGTVELLRERRLWITAQRMIDFPR